MLNFRYKEAISSYDVSYMPISPPIGDGLNISAKAWLENVLTSPGLVSSTVQPIWELLTPVMFPQSDANDLKAQALALQTFIENDFCKVAGCPQPVNSSHSLLAGSMPAGRSDGPGIVLQNGNVYVFGGVEETAKGLVDNNYSAYMIDLNRVGDSASPLSAWSVLSAGPIGAGEWNSGCAVGAAAAEFGNQILIVGSCGTHVYDATLRQWSEGVTMGASRARLGLVGVSKLSPVTQSATNVFAIGGATVASDGSLVPNDTVEVYSTEGSVGWHTAQPLTTPRHSFGVAAVGGFIWVVGGLGATNTVLNSIEVYDISANKWTTLAGGIPDPAIPRYVHHVL